MPQCTLQPVRRVMPTAQKIIRNVKESKGVPGFCVCICNVRVCTRTLCMNQVISLQCALMYCRLQTRQLLIKPDCMHAFFSSTVPIPVTDYKVMASFF